MGDRYVLHLCEHLFVSHAPVETVPCIQCDAIDHGFGSVASDQYAYLLGVYLGDGCLYHHIPGRTHGLQVSLDAIYPGIIKEVADAVETVRGRRPWVGQHPKGTFVNVVSYWIAWPCWFPQHGPGRKHRRPIHLVPWQRQIVERVPGQFLRGLIHTDGWRGTNRVFVKGRWYEYPRYQFSNRSDDIRQLFTWACDLLAIEWRPWGRWHISVARRASVARLDEFVGLKS